MKYSLISVPDYRFGIFFLKSDTRPEISTVDFEPIFLYPSIKCDFEIVLPNMKNGDVLYEALALSAVSTYFFELRGLPLDEIEICHSVSNFTLKNNLKIDFKSSKCKYEFTKGVCELYGVDAEYMMCDGTLFLPCENIDCFDESIFPALALKGDAHFETVLAYSVTDRACHIKSYGKTEVLPISLRLATLFLTQGKMNCADSLDFIFEGVKKINITISHSKTFELKFENLPLA